MSHKVCTLLLTSIFEKMLMIIWRFQCVPFGHTCDKPHWGSHLWAGDWSKLENTDFSVLVHSRYTVHDPSITHRYKGCIKHPHYPTGAKHFMSSQEAGVSGMSEGRILQRKGLLAEKQLGDPLSSVSRNSGGKTAINLKEWFDNLNNMFTCLVSCWEWNKKINTNLMLV